MSSDPEPGSGAAGVTVLPPPRAHQRLAPSDSRSSVNECHAPSFPRRDHINLLILAVSLALVTAQDVSLLLSIPFVKRRRSPTDVLTGGPTGAPGLSVSPAQLLPLRCSHKSFHIIHFDI